jgi:hypothetical protein
MLKRHALGFDDRLSLELTTPSTVPPGRGLSASLPRHLYLFSEAVCGPKGQDNLAQGLPWVISPNRMGPEGAVTVRRGLAPDPTHAHFPPWSPFRAKHVFMSNPG